jgi:D-beta-D-heptose 7-phosphate kinase/D-beta-D-heptose 1-phosphate adenosyltransferase
MHSLYTITSGRSKFGKTLSMSEELSVYYHDLFDFPLTFADLIKWNCSGDFPQKRSKIPVIFQNDYYFLQGRDSLVYKRVLRSRISTKKLEIANKASEVLSLIPGIRMVAATGSLAMNNAGEGSDIDFMIITKQRKLWITRLLVYFLLSLFRFTLRHPGDKHEKDRLCLNLWMDESDLVWKVNDRNLYTAHEIAQILPLVNKNEAYEKFLYKNKWILKFWPNSVRIVNCKLKAASSRNKGSMLEQIAYKIQLNHMKPRITREVVTPTRAVFHPQDWGKVVISRLST